MGNNSLAFTKKTLNAQGFANTTYTCRPMVFIYLFSYVQNSLHFLIYIVTHVYIYFLVLPYTIYNIQQIGTAF